jgi:ABC-2 type transport system ATP-binding protein
MGATKRAAELVGVTKRYGAQVALDRVSLEIERGKVTALLGPNGAGKSTTVGLLLGLCRADEGRVELFGQSPHVLAARRRMGVMLQTAGLVEVLRVRELVELTSSYYPRPRAISEVAQMAGIGGLLGKPYGALSGGQQRRVQFALAICGRPELLFLDEPTTGLDIEARESLWAVVRGLVAEGCAVLLTTHYLEEAEALAHRVELLMHGRIVAAGTVDEIRAMGVRRKIRCVSAVGVEEVREWPGVEEVVSETAVGSGAPAARPDGRARGRRLLEISAVDAEPVVRRLLDSDPGLSELEVVRAGLAEAFVRITRGPSGASEPV